MYLSKTNKINLKIISYYLLILILLLGEKLHSNESDSYLIKTGAGFSVFYYLQFIYDHNIDYSKVSKKENVNSFDLFWRGKLRWEKNNLQKASRYSDFLLYGAALGSIPITSFLMDDGFNKNLLLFLNIISINGVITNFTKIISSRERPLYRFNTSKNRSNETFKSFYSGHTSTAFAIATTTALLFSKKYPSRKKIIWLSSYSLSSLTGYYRIASDNHYATDVLFGAIMGTIVGYLIGKEQPENNPKISFGVNSIRYSYEIR